ncbi:MAG TPA: heavy metal translocating P-type ATPase [Planctomycetota bacterium]|nr:heavy metal translocating P-type ATPase [Planctomycetota bacterium]
MSNGSTASAREHLVSTPEQRSTASQSSASVRTNKHPANNANESQAQKSAPSPFALFALTAICALAGVIAYFCQVRQIQIGGVHVYIPLFIISYISGGWAPVREVFNALRERRLDVNLLMVLAAIGAIVIGHWGEGATLLFLFSLSGALEKYTLERTARSIEALVELRPDTALVFRDGTEVRVPLEQIALGEIVRVLPGERLGVDGVVTEGDTNIDESTITGESMPVSKRVGDDVFAGTLNHRGSILVKVERTANETMLAKIVQTVRAAQDEKPETERFIYRWQKPYVICVLLGTAAVFGVHAFYLAQSFSDAAYRAMTLLVGASPCAVVIAAPAATLAAITRAARHGVLFKGGVYLEKLADVKVVAFDKTGTITKGEPVITTVWSADEGEVCTCPDGSYGKKCGRLLQLAASIEQRSEHTLAQAVVAEARRAGMELLNNIEDFESHVGQGVHGHINGRWVGVGKLELFESHRRRISERLKEKALEMKAAGQTVLIVVEDGGVSGVICVADAIRPEAAATIRRLKELGVEQVAILTGDHTRVAESVAKQVGADRVHAGLLPDQKVTEIARIHRRSGNVVMVGDGVNDAPALAVADVGIAMGGAGTDVALETADVVLMKNDLRGVATAIWLGHRTRATISRGLLFAFGIIGFLVISSMLNFIPLWVAVLFHEGSTVITIFSGLWLLIEKEPRD